MEVTLYQPQIPQNVGSIARTCAATGVKLNIIKPFPFDISEKAVRRAGLDYWHLVQLEIFESFNEYWFKKKDSTHWLVENYGRKSLFDCRIDISDILLFGKETTGVGTEVLEKIPPEKILKIPILSGTVRSLNLSNCVTVSIYEVLRKNNFLGFS